MQYLFVFLVVYAIGNQNLSTIQDLNPNSLNLQRSVTIQKFVPDLNHSQKFVKNITDQKFAKNITDQKFAKNITDQKFAKNITDQSFAKNITDQSFLQNITGLSLIEISNNQEIQTIKDYLTQLNKNIKQSAADFVQDSVSMMEELTNVIKKLKNKIEGTVDRVNNKAEAKLLAIKAIEELIGLPEEKKPKKKKAFIESSRERKHFEKGLQAS